MTAATGTKSVGSRPKSRLPFGFQRAESQSLKASVRDHRNPERALFPITFRYIHALDGLWFPRSGAVLHPVGQLGLVLRQQRNLTINARRCPTSVDLRDPPHAGERVTAGTEHQLLQIPDLGQVSCLRCRE